MKKAYGGASPAYRLAEKLVNGEVRATAIYTMLMRKEPGGDRNRDFYTDPLNAGQDNAYG